MKKVIIIIILITMVTAIVGCSSISANNYTKYTDSFMDTFDTLTVVVAYAKSEEEFKAHFNKIHARLQELHKLFDIYNSYEGINNIKTINDKAGIEPVKVQKEIIDLILLGKEWYHKTNGNVNIALGPVLSIWKTYRDEGLYDPDNAKIPPIEILKEAYKYCNLDDVLIDIEKSTVYLPHKNMRLDVGAIAKGYATELVAKELYESGFTSLLLGLGGNVRALNPPLDDVRDSWGIAIQNPSKSIVPSTENILDTIFVRDASVVTSGDYQRYYMVDDEVLHHLIHPDTLMPANHFKAVTIYAEDSGIADIISTAAFLLPYEESRAFIEGLEGVEAIWMLHNEEIIYTDGMKEISKQYRNK